MEQVCVDGAMVEITAPDGQILVTTVANIPGGTEQKLMVAGKPVLVKKDIENWMATFVTNYEFSSFKGGMIQCDQLTKIEPLSEKLLPPAGAVVLANTEIEILAKANVPGVDSQNLSDSASQAKVTLQVKFTSTGQEKISAV
jgi:hypothetical protein